MMIKTIAAISLIISATAAGASVYDDCTNATASGDKDAAMDAANTILGFVPAPRDLPKEVYECLNYAFGVEHVYDAGSGKIITIQEQDDAVARRKAFADRIDAMRTKAAEDAALLKENAQDILRMKAARELAVNQRLVQGCRSLFKKDPDTAITNKMCYDVFMAVGLPD